MTRRNESVPPSEHAWPGQRGGGATFATWWTPITVRPIGNAGTGRYSTPRTSPLGRTCHMRQDAHRTRSAEKRRESLDIDEGHHPMSGHVCVRFHRSQKRPATPSHGGGHWFDPCSAHHEKPPGQRELFLPVRLLPGRVLSAGLEWARGWSSRCASGRRCIGLVPGVVGWVQ